MSAPAVRVVLITAPSAEEGRRLAHALVEEGLAACVNVVPGVVSVYRWEGSVQEAEEQLLIAKTTQGSLADLERRVVELHSYDVPEVVALEVRGGHAPYLEWVSEASGI